MIDLRLGDCLEVLKTLEDNSVDSIVTDPPYGLGFMGKEWDTFDKNQFGNIPDECSDKNVYNKKGFKTLPRYKTDGLYQFTNDWAKECFRVLKPGGHLLSFAGSRTYHKICMGIEDAGFEVRDQIMWVYGSGFPKSHNIGKAVDKIQGNEREVVGDNPNHRTTAGLLELGFQDGKESSSITRGNSEWEGWGTALKPAHEPICMARKPLSEKSIAANVLKHGTGGINIDDCRIGSEVRTTPIHSEDVKDDTTMFGLHKTIQHERVETTEGRFPANIMFDEEAGKILDEQSGISKSTKRKNPSNTISKPNIDFGGGLKFNNEHNDSGGASRFFYCPKVSKKERDMNMTGEEKPTRKWRDDKGMKLTGSGNPRNEMGKNTHPTVKPIKLMEYLITLVTPKGGVVLEPFMGSGSTGIAAKNLGMSFIGIEKEEEYFEIAKQRINGN